MWNEVYEGGSPEAEERFFETLARRMQAIQETNRKKANLAIPSRTLHAKQVVGVNNARLEVAGDLPIQFCVADFKPLAQLPVTLRLSNASGIARPDGGPDMRGAALRIGLPDGRAHDLLMTSYPVSHARNAKQFVRFAEISSGSRRWMLPKMLLSFGPSETKRMINNIKSAVRSCTSLALESYWTRGSLLWSTGGPVRVRLAPRAGASKVVAVPENTSNYLSTEFNSRLAKADVLFDLWLQPFQDEVATPIEDGAVEWKDEENTSIRLGTVVIPSQDLTSESGVASQAAVDDLAFNPWNCPNQFRPLGNINRARRQVYSASAAKWQSNPTKEIS